MNYLTISLQPKLLGIRSKLRGNCVLPTTNPITFSEKSTVCFGRVSCVYIQMEM